MTKWVYSFGPNGSDGREDMRQLLGGKGANLAEMASLHLPVPPGFTITTEVCAYQIKHGQYPDDLDQQVKDALKSVEQEVGHSFGDPEDPLLVSVRSGAPVSMPLSWEEFADLDDPAIFSPQRVQEMLDEQGDARDRRRRCREPPDDRGGHDRRPGSRGDAVPLAREVDTRGRATGGGARRCARGDHRYRSV